MSICVGNILMAGCQYYTTIAMKSFNYNGKATTLNTEIFRLGKLAYMKSNMAKVYVCVWLECVYEVWMEYKGVGKYSPVLAAQLLKLRNILFLELQVDILKLLVILFKANVRRVSKHMKLDDFIYPS